MKKVIKNKQTMWIVGGIALLIASYFGYNYYQKRKKEKADADADAKAKADAELEAAKKDCASKGKKYDEATKTCVNKTKDDYIKYTSQQLIWAKPVTTGKPNSMPSI